MQFSRQPRFHETETLADFFDETSRDHETRNFFSRYTKYLVNLFVIDKENLLNQGGEVMEDNTFATKTFHSIDKRFALNATSMLNQTNTSLREDFSASQMNLDLHTKESKDDAI